MKTILGALLLPLKLCAWLLVFCVPTLGVWLASSIAAYLGGPVWLACATGLFLFPVLPLAWDIWATRRFERKQDEREAAAKPRTKRHVSFTDRLILRTFFLNIGFVALLVGAYPQLGFTAIATRGDWILDGWKSPRADVVRPVLFAAAEGLEWAYQLSRENPYERFDDEEPTPTPTPDEFGDTETRVLPPTPTQTPTPESAPRAPGDPPAWPMPDELHPLVAEMPESVKTSYEDVARYIGAHESDPFLRVKALNDFIAHRVAYDVPALSAAQFPPQDPKTVFETKLAVCAGYAKLLVAMAEITGDEVVYVTGVSRDESGGVAGGGHAWNAARIAGKWYLIDTTWNAGYVNGDTFTRRYRTDYLFTPPEAFGSDHLPDEEHWQLRPDPITRGEFIRQPMLRPEFHALGLRLLTPRRSQVDATGGTVVVRIDNPNRKKIFANAVPRPSGQVIDCETSGVREIQLRCAVPAGETYALRLFAGPPQETWYPMVGQFEVVSR